MIFPRLGRLRSKGLHAGTDTRDCVGLGTFPTRLHLLLRFLGLPPHNPCYATRVAFSTCEPVQRCHTTQNTATFVNVFKAFGLYECNSHRPQVALSVAVILPFLQLLQPVTWNTVDEQEKLSPCVAVLLRVHAARFNERGDNYYPQDHEFTVKELAVIHKSS